jgi:hypothetical protein
MNINLNNTNFGRGIMTRQQTGANNSAFGAFSLHSNIDASSNTSVGSNSLLLNNGQYNTAIGAGTMWTNVAGKLNTAIGSNALQGITNQPTVGDSNVAIGAQALFTNSGNENTAIGAFALMNQTTGLKNVAIGHRAGLSDISGSNNVYIGNDADTIGSFTNSLAIGSNSKIQSNNEIRLGVAGTKVYIGDIQFVGGGGGGVGPAGETGPAGTKGDTGPAGTNGLDGAKGDTGPAGPPGSSQTKGDTGPAGTNGLDGAKGDTGPAGTNGLKGDTGPAGTNGLDGSKGDTGPAGTNGLDGSKGDTGPAGEPGLPGSATAYVYTEMFVNDTDITIPTGCNKFDIVIIGTGGAAGTVNSQFENSTGEYYLTMGGTGGGGQVVKSNGILIPKQDVYFKSTMNLSLNVPDNDDNSRLVTCLKLNNVIIAGAFNGNNGTITVGGTATSGTPHTDSKYTWNIYQGDAGQNGPFKNSYNPNTGQIGGGNIGGGIIGYPNIPLTYQPGQGQKYSSFSGQNGMQPFSQSTRQGGCIVTWYILK